MKYYSTNNPQNEVSFKEAVVKGIASDRGLFMPEQIPTLPKVFFKNISNMTLQEISFVVANTFFGKDIPADVLKEIVYDTLSFDIPLVYVTDNIYSLELFHGPTLAFKDVGARFMARILGYYNSQEADNKIVNVLVATSGDTGSAVANGFLGVKGVNVFVLYPKGKVSKIQESQFATLGQNVTSIEVRGSFDECQQIVKNAFDDIELNEQMKLTSANSINVARFLPQMFYYFYAYAQLAQREQPLDNIVVSVPSGNFGNICAAIFAKKMGLPIKRFIAANNSNDIFYKYLLTGHFEPKPSVSTIANAMDVGNPSNFVRILSLYKKSHEEICKEISGCSYSDEQISETIYETYKNRGYLLDPHGAVAYRSLLEMLNDDEVGIFTETAHPAKFKGIVENIIDSEVEVPEKLLAFMKGEKKSICINADYSSFKNILLSHQPFC